MSSTVMITGANRGIGLEFARQYSRDGWTVIGTARNPRDADELQSLGESVSVEKLDVTDPVSVKSAAEEVRSRTDSLELLINNAGVMGSKERFEELEADELERVFDVNCLGAFRVTQSLKPLLEESGGTLANVTSLMGSIEDNRSGGSYPYRISKAGLNMFTKTLSEDVSPREFLVVLLHPGWVQTRMGGSNAKITTEESVSGMREVLKNLTSDDHGKFLSYDAEELPW